MRSKIALLLVVLFALAGWPGVGLASSPIVNAINQLNASGLESNAEISHAYIDLTSISSGTVSSKVYSGGNQDIALNSYSNIQSQTYIQAHDRLTRFIFTLTNQYRPGTDLALSGTGSLPTVQAYTYGTMKDEAIWAVVNGLPDCLGNPPINGGGNNGGGSNSSWVDKYSPNQIANTIATTTTFSINRTAYTISDSTTKKTKTLQMDVAPEIIGNRTFVPVRYLAYALGVPESGVQWNDSTNSVNITNGQTNINLTIGNDTEIINGKPQKMDAAPYIKEIGTGGRTMLPARWVAEPLGAKVTWLEESQQMKIKLPQPQTQQ